MAFADWAITEVRELTSVPNGTVKTMVLSFWLISPGVSKPTKEKKSIDLLLSLATTALLFSIPPIASSSRLDPNRLRMPQGARSGMAAIMGRWPGDETEEEIEQALERVS